MTRPFNPLAADSPSLGAICRLCGSPLLIGQTPSLITDSEATYVPGSEALERLQQGRPHNAVAAVVHWQCVLNFNLDK